MRKAFMRTPVNFSRISSRFNLRRKHPVLNTIRAHKGVDYAARTGTPVKATGDGVVVHKGTKGGYGRTVILKHGGKYTTLYAHMSKYAGSVKVGTRVKQGQTIGYVGSSGLATGPHLHYEFRVNGVHRNPLKVKLPKALKYPMPSWPTSLLRLNRSSRSWTITLISLTQWPLSLLLKTRKQPTWQCENRNLPKASLNNISVKCPSISA